MSIKLKWVPIEGADIASYKVYRSMIGVRTPIPAPFGLVSGDTLIIKANSNVNQTITFTANLGITALVTFLNSNMTGATAYKSQYNDTLILRSNIRSTPGYISIVGGSARTKMGLTITTYSEKSSVLPIVTLPFGTDNYEDLDGVLEDFYGMSTIDNSANESNISTLRQAINFTGPICVVEGCITNLSGMRVTDVKVTARIVTPPTSVVEHSFITKDTISVLTGEDGRFSIPLLQGARVIFEIDDARVSDPITIPNTPYVFFDTLDIDENYKFEA